MRLELGRSACTLLVYGDCYAQVVKYLVVVTSPFAGVCGVGAQQALLMRTSVHRRSEYKSFAFCMMASEV